MADHQMGRVCGDPDALDLAWVLNHRLCLSVERKVAQRVALRNECKAETVRRASGRGW